MVGITAQKTNNKKKTPPNGRDHAISITVVIAALLVLYAIFVSGMSAINKFSLSIFLLVGAGLLISRFEKMNGAFGFYTAGTTKGISVIDSTSRKHPAIWEALAMWGVVLGFGLASYPLLRGRISKRVLVLGLVTLIFMQLFVLQYLSYPLQFINISQITSRVQPTSLQMPNIYDYLITLLDLVFGFSGYIFFAIWANAASILYSLVVVAGTVATGHIQTTALAQQIPGVAPVLPGITIPLFSGILAIAVILSIHEFSHGVLARIKKLKIKSVGMPIFGIIPIGGYVEIDEKKIGRLSNVDQTKIFSAGIASNFLATIVFLLLMLPLIYFVVPHMYKTQIVIANTTKGYPAYGVIPQNAVVISWNGKNVSSIASLEAAGASDSPGKTVNLFTNTGNYSLVAVQSPGNSSRGIIGVDLVQESVPVGKGPEVQAWMFVYSFVALTFLLNFLVGTINLLPFPMMDGWRIYKTNMSSRIVKIFAALIIIGLVLNVLPWFAIL